ncbi:hypothetical protein KSS87_018328 [Heliosperma pusillum]|nr:hypothetical protein KSS87_020215 [Heliosperma pusillum]KAH9621877.1 hypothetical protein KSS87_018328 [Heliosperma pusillum]
MLLSFSCRSSCRTRPTPCSPPSSPNNNKIRHGKKREEVTTRHRNVKPRLGFRSWTLTKLNYFHKLSTIKEMDLTEQMCRCAGKQTEDLTSDKSFSMTNGRGERDFERKVYIMCNCATHVHISVSLLNCLRTRPSHLLLGVVDIN